MVTKKAAKKATRKRAPAKKATTRRSKELYIDRSNGAILEKKDLDKKKPWLSPISGQATVEKLTQEEIDAL